MNLSKPWTFVEARVQTLTPVPSGPSFAALLPANQMVVDRDVLAKAVQEDDKN
jgi:hypothetical protein